jgi:hypothetical protein
MLMMMMMTTTMTTDETLMTYCCIYIYVYIDKEITQQLHSRSSRKVFWCFFLPLLVRRRRIRYLITFSINFWCVYVYFLSIFLSLSLFQYSSIRDDNEDTQTCSVMTMMMMLLLLLGNKSKQVRTLGRFLSHNQRPLRCQKKKVFVSAHHMIMMKHVGRKTTTTHIHTLSIY